MIILEWIAKRLKISEATVTTAVERLIRVQLLRIKDDGTFVCSDDFTAAPSDIPSRSLKQYHTQILDKAHFALRTQSVNERDFSAVIMALNDSDLKKFKDLIREFRRELG